MSNTSGFVGGVQRGFSTGLFASVGTDSTLTVNLNTQRGVNQRHDEFWMENSGATEHMTHDPSGLEDFELTTAGQHMEDAGCTLLPVAVPNQAGVNMDYAVDGGLGR